MAWGETDRPEDRALVSGAGPGFLACFFVPSPPFPAPPDEVLLAYGGATAEVALARAGAGGSRSASLVLERIAGNNASWPGADPATAPAYILRPGRCVVLVPCPTLRPIYPPLEPHCVVRVVAVSTDEAEARARVAALPVRAIAARVCAIVDVESGCALPGVTKEGARMGVEGIAARGASAERT